MAIQWQIFITTYAITLSKTASQCLWTNNKKIKFYKLILVLKSLQEKELIHLLRSGANSRHTSLTLSKHSPQHQSGLLPCLGGEFVRPKYPHLILSGWFSSYNGFLPAWCRAIARTNAKSSSKYKYFRWRNPIENVHNMSTILFRPQCVNLIGNAYLSNSPRTCSHSLWNSCVRAITCTKLELIPTNLMNVTIKIAYSLQSIRINMVEAQANITINKI